MITAPESSWIIPFPGLSPRCFCKLIAALRHGGADPVRKGRPWSLALEDRVLLLIAYWRTNFTLRAPLFGISKSSADGSIDHLGLSLALRPRISPTQRSIAGQPLTDRSLSVRVVGGIRTRAWFG